MVVDWEQETGLLMTSGDVRVVRIWDTDREMKVQVGVAQPRFQDFHQGAWKTVLETSEGVVQGSCVWPHGRPAGLDQMNTSLSHTHTPTPQS